MKTTDTAQVALYLPFAGWKPTHNDGGSKILTLGFVNLAGTQVRNISCSMSSDHNKEYADFELSTYARWETYDHQAEWSGGTSFDAEYRSVYNVDRMRCDVMHAMFKRLAKIEFPVQPKSFGQYVALMCAALKVKQVVKALSGGSWHNETHHAIGDTKYLESQVDNMIEEFKYRVCPHLRPEGWEERAA